MEDTALILRIEYKSPHYILSSQQKNYEVKCETTGELRKSLGITLDLYDGKVPPFKAHAYKIDISAKAKKGSTKKTKPKY